MRTVLATFFAVCWVIGVPVQAQINPIPLTGKMADDVMTFVYDPTGEWWLEHPVNEAAVLEMFDWPVVEQWNRLKSLEDDFENSIAPLATTLEIVSTQDFFTGEKPVWVCGLFDVYSSRKAFKFDPTGFGSPHVAEVVPGLDGETVSQLLTVSGSTIDGGPLHAFDLRVIQPGDFNKDGLLNAPDIDTLTEAIWNDLHTFPTEYDLNNNRSIDQGDRRIWIEDIRNSYFGDANLDGEFNSRDLVEVFTAGEFEDSVIGNTTWATGDWNGDQEFNSGDLVLAFQGGGYEQGPHRSVSIVPEPESRFLLVTLASWIIVRRFSTDGE
jgi:hypothetical protein